MELLKERYKEILGKLHNRKPGRPSTILMEGQLDLLIDLVGDIGTELISSDYVIDQDNDQMIENLILYFIGDPLFPGDLSKGLLMVGGLGTGKTTLFKIFREILTGLQIKDWNLRVVKCTEVVEAWEHTGWEGVAKYKTGAWCFDDLGEENLEANHYGSRYNVMAKILSDRYERWQDEGQITHISTNYIPSLLESKYGERVMDRIAHMSNAMLFNKQINRRFQK